ncbi:f01321a8-b297-4ea3-ad75-a1cca7e037c8-CDS [Sclerotinia trifoliorum]|uniref:F01321a8-b297-4ea3-ad75-a1cca7e037c8-CDS n=1 Tax=Sclerotinia trifoliorum TaxID=28548 RepID=A0A8H2VWX2_9HELO|nr:f01321a8-b297-4ea3-ad75-a1cca7e037c8-CDS [Sclerotinia trifoliorum]
MSKHTVQNNNGVVTTKRHPNVLTQVQMTSTSESKILSPFELLPQAPNSSVPGHRTTAHKLASLLQEIASIMETITGEKMMCGEELDRLEGDVLGGLTEMVLIMEEEVEQMIELADVVEEYVEELNIARVDEWIANPPLSRCNDGTKVGDGHSESQINAVNEWKRSLSNTAFEDGKECNRIGLNDNVERCISLGGLLEKAEEDVLRWRVRRLSVDSDNYGFDESSDVVIGAGISMPITNYRKGVIKETIISLPPRRNGLDIRFRDSGLGFMSPAGVTRIPIKKEPKIVIKSSPIGLRTGFGSTRKKKAVRKPKWV